MVLRTLGPFFLGLIVGSWIVIPMLTTLTPIILGSFVFSVGLELGGISVPFSWRMSLRWLLIIPCFTVVGSLIGGALVASFAPLISVREGLLVSSGLGYYSLSSAIIATQHGPMLASIALLANIFRELIVLLAAPILIRWFGNFSLIPFAAACAMDSCLPVIRESGGPTFVYPALLSGAVLTLTVPILVGLLL